MQMAFQKKRLSFLYLKNSFLAYLSFLTLTIAFVNVENIQCGLKGTFHVYAEEKSEFMKINIVILMSKKHIPICNMKLSDISSR